MVKVSVLRQGNGDRPEAGHLVIVKLAGGRLKDGGAVEMPELLQFPLGGEEVIPGIDLGVAQMSLNERALLEIPASEGYADAGHPAAVPPGGTLLVEVELLGFI
eukprot:TRINITY_DN10510_c0_g1_i1.p2 TRINITY_DN10510_c0_g1~~TRINITY_DN10510_c0_g1_i1.p2  ORF type:complete len:104 (+),score=27.87 TRINITY_DN10510_c0_g1_i1:104-415(+)